MAKVIRFPQNRVDYLKGPMDRPATVLILPKRPDPVVEAFNALMDSFLAWQKALNPLVSVTPKG